MPSALNAWCFQQPHWRVVAAGFATESWFNDTQASGTGGILNPQATHLPTGQYYYRFASSSRPLREQLGGGWWLDFENFRLIESFSREHSYTLREAARLMLALPYAWTRVDLLIRGLLRAPLKAFTGEGKPAVSTGSALDRAGAWIPTQHIRVRQLYIPGLCALPENNKHDADARPLYELAFAWPAQMQSLLQQRARPRLVSP